MKIKRIVGLGLALVLLVTPLAVMAQDDDELELEEYISDDELLTLSYPTG